MSASYISLQIERILTRQLQQERMVCSTCASIHTLQTKALHKMLIRRGRYESEARCARMLRHYRRKECRCYTIDHMKGQISFVQVSSFSALDPAGLCASRKLPSINSLRYTLNAFAEHTSRP